VIVPVASGCGLAETEEPLLVVYGDSYSAGGRQGGNGDDGWPAIVADHLDADLRLHAAGGAGYVNGSPARDETFLDQVRLHPAPDADVVVVFGSRNDTGAPSSEIADRAAGVYAALRTASPSAEVVVIGPAWSDEAVPAETLLARDAVRTAAAGLTFLDPLEEGWFFGRLELIGGDAIHPTDEGHAYLADRIEPVLRDTLD